MVNMKPPRGNIHATPKRVKELFTPSGFPHVNPQLTRTLVDQAIHEKQPNNVLAKKVLSPIEKAL